MMIDKVTSATGTASETPTSPAGNSTTQGSSGVPLSFTINIALNDSNRNDTYALLNWLEATLVERTSFMQDTIKLNAPSEDAEHVTETVTILKATPARASFNAEVL